MTFLALIAAAILPFDAGAVRDYCDHIYVNRVYFDCNGEWKVNLSQVIFADEDHFNPPWKIVRDWRLYKPGMEPQLNSRTGLWEMIWHDGLVLRHVEARWCNELHTDHDPEIEARKRLPQEQRRKLRATEARP